jgi:hypothetical protein
MRHLVTSKDGVSFAVDSDPRSIPFEQAFASVMTAEHLAAHEGFVRADALAVEEHYFSAPRISGPLEKRAAFRVIEGGKQS